MKAWQHFCTITHHKILVLRGCFQVGLYRQGIMHDLSKYGWTELPGWCKVLSRNAEPEQCRAGRDWLFIGVAAS